MSGRRVDRNTVRQFQRAGARCAVIETCVASVSDYLAVFSSGIVGDAPFWFRGHSDFRYELVPSALRHAADTDRDKALDLLLDFRRHAEIKLPRLPDPSDDLYWVQLAQHYGLGTRLLDWTENAAVALYFACQRSDRHGTVYLMNPVTLNSQADAKRPRVLDARKDRQIISKYLLLDGRIKPRGLRTIAVHPVYNSERIVLQKGVFTLHGSRAFGLDDSQEPSLVKMPILAEHKKPLLRELERIGIDEMSVFPELEHVCSQLKQRAQLP